MARAPKTPNPMKPGLDTAQRRIHQAVMITDCIQSDIIAKERNLLTQKWFDYRFMSPVDATLLFIECYNKSYKNHWRRHFDVGESEKRHGLKPGELPRDPRTLTSIWLARQFADSLSVPYERFFEVVFPLWIDAGQRLPRPNQLYSPKWADNVTRLVHAKSREYMASTLQWSLLPHYRTSAGVATELREIHVEWCLELLKERFGRPDQIARAVYELELVPEAVATAAFGEEKMERARESLSGHTPSAGSGAAPAQHFMPSCAYLPQAFDAANSVCQRCHFAPECSRAAPKVIEHLKRRHGSEDPMACRKREATRQRVQRHREKKRTGSSAPSLKSV